MRESDGVTRYAAPAYFQKMIRAIAAEGAQQLPDYVTFHPFLVCPRDGLSDVEHFTQVIVEMRSAMKAVGLQNRDLIATEFTHTSESEAEVIQRMEQYVDVLVNLRDPNLGHPKDGHRMVQRWAWYLFYFWDANDDRWDSRVSLYEPGSWPTPHLSPVGRKYQELIAKYVLNNSCVIQGIKKTDEPKLAEAADTMAVRIPNFQPAADAGDHFAYRLPGNRTYNVTLDLPNGYWAYSTQCTNRINCHGSTDQSRVNGGRAKAYCPAGGYVDLWWHFGARKPAK
jgi:hypothetical protein